MRCLLFVVAIVMSTPAFAGWVQEDVELDVDTGVQIQIAGTLFSFPQLTTMLSALNLSSPSHAQVTHIKAHRAWYRWENDATCTVPDAEIPHNQRMVKVSVKFIYTHEPTMVSEAAYSELVGLPCNGPLVKTVHQTLGEPTSSRR